MANNAPIGVFDSGVGGLTVAKEIMRQMPNEELIYFGDTARVPYGSKSKETIIKFSRQIVHFLKTKHVKAIVIACNTASALALDAIEAEEELPILGVVKPGARTAIETTKNGHIGIIGTEATINSGLYSEYIHQMSKQTEVYAKACPLFVPLVEENMLFDSVTEQIADRYLNELKQYDIDTLVLGCTHYPLLSYILQKVAGENVTLVNPALETAKELKRVLTEKDLLREEGVKKGTDRYYVSDGSLKFQTFANSILPCEVMEVKDILIEQLQEEV